ncbi:MAG: TraB/GumN family protein [Helicobacteraceae bacterium]|jgi:uncharacterized protein YbaP (TraB family)|nr:TraB/GumN family protein [Helicobacteraceae bacterium]
MMCFGRVLSFLFVVFCLFAPSVTAKTSVETLARYPFYLAEKNGVKIYLLGSMHLGKPADRFNDKIITALKTSTTLVLELAPSELNSIDPLRFICDTPCLKDQIGDRLFNMIIKKYPAITLMPYMDRMPAWYIGSLLSVFDYIDEGILPAYGVESMLEKHAQKITIVGLESADEQIEAMTSISAKAQLELLEDYLLIDKTEMKRYINELREVFLDGNADRMLKWYLKTRIDQIASQETIDEFNEKLIFKRNQRFLQRLKTHINPKLPIFVAIGALHLGGDKGVLELLRKEGYKIKRL